MSALTKRGPLAVLAALFLYGLAFIARTSFPVDGVRYFSLLDDAMISMRYAKNFALGHGLVWNPGEYVEGFTNLLWTLYMSLWHLLPIPAHLMSLPIQLTSLAALIIAGVQVYRIIERMIEGQWLRIAALFMAMFYFPLVLWSLLGMEVGIITAMLMIAVRMVVEGEVRGKRLYALYLLLGVMTLVRFDTVIYLAAITLYLAWRDAAARGRYIALFAATFVIFIGGQTLWRLSYYGELFPNTYYLKMTGFPVLHRITRGIYELYHFAQQPGLILFLLPLVWSLWRRTPLTNFFLILIATATLYSAYVGGDAWEWYGGANRYLLPVMPLYFILLFRMIGDLWGMFREKPAVRIGKVVAAISIAILYISFNTPNITAWNPTSLDELLLLERPFEVPDHIPRVEQALWLSANMKQDARIAIAWAGITPYFTDRYFIDFYGKTDRHVARTEGKYWTSTRPIFGFVPGHSKWDYSYSIGKLKPDVVAQLIKHDEVPHVQLKEYNEVKVGQESLYLRIDGVDR